MNESVDELALTNEGRLEAGEHWEALMFAPSRTALESARIALTKASLPIQLAVMADINEKWLEEYEPQREENPFRDTPPLPVVLPQALVEQEVLPLTQPETLQAEISQQQQNFLSIATRLNRWLKSSLTLNNHATPMTIPLHKATIRR